MTKQEDKPPRKKINPVRARALSTAGDIAERLAHEIRNPLGSMKIYLSLIIRDLQENRPALEKAEKISDGIESIEAVISNFLTFTSDLTPRVGQTDITKTVNNALEFAMPLFNEKGINVVTDLPDEPLFIGIDEGLLRQALLNFFQNAVYACREEGGLFRLKVRRSSQGDKDGVTITIIDNGQGVRSDIRHKIFDPFFSTKENGSGLGLAIVSQIINAHGGTVDLGSPPDGEGSVFTIWLPSGRR